MGGAGVDRCVWPFLMRYGNRHSHANVSICKRAAGPLARHLSPAGTALSSSLLYARIIFFRAVKIINESNYCQNENDIFLNEGRGKSTRARAKKVTIVASGVAPTPTHPLEKALRS